MFTVFNGVNFKFWRKKKWKRPSPLTAGLTTAVPSLILEDDDDDVIDDASRVIARPPVRRPPAVAAAPMEDEDAHLSPVKQWRAFKVFVNIETDPRFATLAEAQPAGNWIRTRPHWRELSEMML